MRLLADATASLWLAARVGREVSAVSVDTVVICRDGGFTRCYRVPEMELRWIPALNLGLSQSEYQPKMCTCKESRTHIDCVILRVSRAWQPREDTVPRCFLGPTTFTTHRAQNIQEQGRYYGLLPVLLLRK